VSAADSLIVDELGVTVTPVGVNFATVTVVEALASAKFESPL
jgi:hypothetical protein